ncbi:cellulose-binding domain-containing protein [Teredinibacter turnerae]|uniref:cellulose-binding domain-containing protein n=1 Tax=Teredinibacter turnerae TaxID=2426 RepID=UPI001F07D8DC|nr:cellulose-binding domain-containing protein [Teredinibacter turnerae]
MPTPPTYARHYTANHSSTLSDNDQDGYFESITSQPYSLSIRKFAAIDEVSVICYDASYPGEIVGSELTISIQGYTSSTTQVNIFAIPGENPITPDMASLPGELLGTYYPTQLQLGEHHVELDSSTINAELFTEAGICLRIEGDIIPTNTQLSPNAQLTIWLDSPPGPSPIPSTTPTPTPVPTITPLPSLEPTPVASHTLDCRHIVSSDWESGFAADIEIRNLTDVPVSGWNVIWTYDNGEDVTQSWNANVTGANPFSATNLSWNSIIPPGGIVKFGFIGSKTGEVSQPTWGGDCSQSL